MAKAKKPAGIIEIERDILLEPLKKAIPAVDNKVSLPTLSGALITVEGERLRVTCTDCEMEFQASAEYTGEPFSICPPAKRFREVLEALPSLLLLELPKEPGGKLTLRAGRGHWSIPSFDPAHFPAFDDAKSIKGRFFISCNALKKALAVTAHAMAKQDVRYYLNGAGLSAGDHDLVIQASDGHRAAQAATDIEWDDGRPSEPVAAILPRKFVECLISALSSDDEPAVVTVRECVVSVVLPGDLVMSTKLVEGRYPDLGRVVPASFEHWMEVDSGALKELIKRVMLPGNQDDRVELALEQGDLILSADNQVEDSQDNIPVSVQEGMAEAGLNGRYFLQAMDALGGKSLKVYFKKGGTVMKLTNPELERAFCIVMGMRK